MKIPSFQLEKSMSPQESVPVEYITIFQIKKIYKEITERYYYKFNIDKLSQMNGNAKEKIHDIMAEIFRQKQTGIEIESDDGEMDCRTILLSLTANAFVYENFRGIW